MKAVNSYTSDIYNAIQADHCQERSLKVVAESLLAFAQKKKLISEKPYKISGSEVFLSCFKAERKKSHLPDLIKTGDVQDGLNLVCCCYQCGTRGNPKQFLVNLNMKNSWNLPRIMKRVKCPICHGTPSEQSAVVTMVTFYNCSWTITGASIQDPDGEISTEGKTQKRAVTCLKQEPDPIEAKGGYLVVWCGPLN